MHCPCGLTKTYNHCCGRFISGKESARTPTQLMRSRYTAYSQANIDYIIKTMQGPAAFGFNREEAKQWATACQWKKLDVKKSWQECNVGFVEFEAFYVLNNITQSIHELSEFHRVDGKWFYVQGKMFP